MEHVPIRPPTYFVLAALKDEPAHGYVLLKSVEELSAGSVRLAAGSLYAVLDRLSVAGLIETVREETVNGRARRYYALTPQGREVLHAEATRMAAAAKVVLDDKPQRRAARGATARGAAVKPA